MIFDKVQKWSSGERIAFLTNGSGTGPHAQDGLGYTRCIMPKIDLEHITGLNVNLKTTQFLEENLGDNFMTLG